MARVAQKSHVGIASDFVIPTIRIASASYATLLAYSNSRAAQLSTLERETGIEPATNSLEGCDSTIELLPPWKETRTA
jgi:hypothetical protein